MFTVIVLGVAQLGDKIVTGNSEIAISALCSENMAKL